MDIPIHDPSRLLDEDADGHSAHERAMDLIFERVPAAELERLAACPFELCDDRRGIPFFFGQVYLAASMLAQPGVTVVDFGCSTGVQAALFQHAAAYIGVDSLPMAPIPGRELDIEWSARYEAPGVRHVEQSIQSFCDEHAQRLARPDILAICSYVPDQEARRKVREVCWNVVDVYAYGGGRAWPIG